MKRFDFAGTSVLRPGDLIEWRDQVGRWLHDGMPSSGNVTGEGSSTCRP